jgi:hypothetical protein
MTQLDKDFLDWLRSSGYVVVKQISGGRWAGIHRLAYHWSIKVGKMGDRVSWDDSWCYTDEFTPTLKAFIDWAVERNGEGEPEGWYRNPRTGRRRPKDGEEEIRW